ncbi:MAG: hypothetical protein PVF58_07100 [Candidatus Methanofastidiosia archaeon]
MRAVAATITDDVPTAILIGTPQTSTINGILKEPPDIPTIPATNPVASVTGIAIHKLTVYSYSSYYLCQNPNPCPDTEERLLTLRSINSNITMNPFI